MIRKLGIAILFLIVASQAYASFPTYTGFLSGADGGLLGTGSWLFQSLVTPEKDKADWFAPSLNWTVSQNSDLSWHYDYTLSVYKKGISHFTVEASKTFGYSDIWDAQGPFGAVEIQDYEPSQSSNPGMPSIIHGIKFDSTNGTNIRITFDSDRTPVWGDFYSKDGVDKGTNEWNAVWNAGFTGATPHIDPIAPITNGSFDNHVLVPDTTTNMTPEPTSFVALAAGCMGLLGLTRRRRR